MDDPLHPYGDPTLIFSHSALKDSNGALRPLVVGSGANSVKWSYRLNTAKFPTYGGEVIQILSAQIGTLMISGNSKNNIQLAQIYHWFRAYMTLAGKAIPRNVEPVKFRYPERGWELGLYVTKAPSFRLGLQDIGTEWKIEAEVNQSDASILEDEVMKPMSYPMTVVFNNLPKGIGYIPNNKYSAPIPDIIAVGASDAEIRNATQRLQTTTANNIGSSFEALIAAWSGGDFTSFLFDATKGASGNNLHDPDDIWKSIFDSPYVDGSTGTTTPVGGSYAAGDTNYPGDNSGAVAIATWIASKCIQNGIPPEVGLCCAAGESNFNPHSGNNSGAPYEGLFQIGGSGGFNTTVGDHPASWWGAHPEESLQWFIEANKQIMQSEHTLVSGDLQDKINYSVGAASGTATRLNWWCYRVERSGEANATNEYYANQLHNAVVQAALKNVQSQSSTGGNPSQAHADVIKYIKNGRITGTDLKDLVSGSGTTLDGSAQGLGAPVSAPISDDLYIFLAWLAKNHTVRLGSVMSSHYTLVHPGDTTTRPLPRSNHSFGKAFDITALDGVEMVTGNQRTYMLEMGNVADQYNVKQIIGACGLSGGVFSFLASHNTHIHIGL